jgi:hypothetical protein
MADAGTAFSLGAALVSAGGALWAFWSARRLERDRADAAAQLKRLEAELGAEGRLQDARTRYEWEARKRLYEEVEPVLFLTGEVMELTFGRIANMAQIAAAGHMGRAPDSWMTGPEDHYLITTIFRVLRPLACHRMMMEKLTRLDFSLDTRAQTAYVLAKMYRDVLSGPFDLAKRAPALPYRYLHPADGHPYQVEDERAQHIQHFYTDELETIVDALLVRDAEGHLALKRYGDFRTEQKNPHHATARLMRPALRLFEGMAPETRPVLWRALLACALLSKVMLDVLTERAGSGRSLGGRLAEAQRGGWVAELRAGGNADPALEAELAACVAALRARLEGNRVAHIRLA